MKNRYKIPGSRCWLLVLWALSFALPVGAQTAQPPIIQWQRVIESGVLPSQIVRAANGDYGLTTYGGINAPDGVIRLSESGNTIWQVQLPSTSQLLFNGRIQSILAMPDGGFVLLVKGYPQWSLVRLTASGTLLWAYPFDSVSSDRGRDYKDLVGSTDGGFIVLGNQDGGRDSDFVTLLKFNSDGNQVLSKALSFSYPSEPRSSSVGNRIIQTPDGAYAVVGYSFPRSGSASGIGWFAKLDAQLNAVQQQRYEYLSRFTDVVPTPYGPGGYIAVGINKNSPGTSTLFINPNGTGDNTSGTYRPSALGTVPMITSSSGSHEVADDIDQNSKDIRLTSFTNFNETRWIRTLGGSGDEVVKDLIATDDGGYLLVGTTTSTDGDVQGKATNDVSTWIVKLGPATPTVPTNSLTLIQPTYNCQTGAITFNTTGGDGSPIVYSAPGITRANATDNFGTVESGLRNDPKPITITATQNGQTASYTFDFGAVCGNPQPPSAGIDPPALLGLIPDQTRTVGELIVANIISISSYFRAPGATKSFRPVLKFTASGLPDGMIMFDASSESNTLAYIGGTPTTVGNYVVTIRATVANAPDMPATITTVKISIVDKPVTGGTLTLTPPTYTCQTGAITFNTTGGDGSPITYSAPGITRANATDNVGTVEPGLRNDPKPITITATQNGYTTSYTFDFGAYCNNPQPPQPPVTPPTSGALTLLAPAYDCSSGALTFKTSGGNGSPIEYQAAGITGWTTNPNQFVDQDSRTANDVQPFMLMARQSGQVITYTWDLKAACGRARLAAPVVESKPTLTVLGNPVADQLRVAIRGVAEGTVRFTLTDTRGRLIESRQIEMATAEDQQVFDLSQQPPGLLLLRATTGRQVLTTKVLKR